MIGWVHNVLMTMLDQVGGIELRHAVLQSCGMPADCEFRIDRNYPDEECRALLGAAVTLTGMSEAEFHESYARAFLARSEELFPAFFGGLTSSRQMLMRQPAIHRTIGAGLRAPAEREEVAQKFSVIEDGPDLRVIYRSANMFCSLYRVLAHMLADRWGEEIVVETTSCRKRGARACQFRLSWPCGKTRAPVA